MLFLRKLHKWLGLIVGLQLLLWAASGLVFAWLDHHEVSGEHSTKMPEPMALSPPPQIAEPAVWLADYAGLVLYEVKLASLLGKPVWWVETARGIELRDVADGRALAIDESVARNLAVSHYAGEGRLVSVDFQSTPGLETRDAGPVWRAQFDDAGQTSLYFAADDGRLVASRNSTWRLFDFFWMLHTMDYRGRDNFNNPLVITVGTAALWLSLSGLLLLLRSFRRQDFDLIGAWRRRTPLRIINGTSGDRAEVSIDAGRNLYLALEAAGIELPSNCGGGGSCGLCVVQFRSSAPMPVSEERSLLSKTALEAGMRLACRHHGRDSAEIEVADAALTSARRDMVITRERFLTPFMKELTLHPGDGRPFSFRAGSYLQIDVPAEPVSIASLQIPRHVAAEWIHLKAGSSSRSQAIVRRSYSMANAPGEIGDELRLNVRAMPPSDQGREAPWGRGSTYLFSQRPGDRIQVRGPYGMFCHTGSTREKIFIGGGAGMAPLRSIIVDLLRNRASSARISYWYGARTRRELFYREDFEQLAREFRNFSWHVALSDVASEDEWDGSQGYIHQVVHDVYLNRHPDPRSCEYYLCGPPAMLTATRAMLTTLGVPNEQVSLDDFGI